ncbi:MAG: MraY family glycosyltransferase [Bacteroidota bacterium]
MLIYFITLLSVSFLVAFAMIKRTILFSKLFKIQDQNDSRKIHVEQVSALGGIGVYFGILAGSFLAIFMGIPYPGMLAILIFPLFFLGIWDDAYKVPVKTRLLVQFGTASLIWLMGYRLPGFPDWLILAGFLNFGCSFFFILLLINAYNLIDGINGLCGGLAVIGFTVLGGLFLFIGAVGFGAFSFIAAAAVLAFLIFNFGTAKIFLGDNGSTVVGFLIAALILKFIGLDSHLPEPSTSLWLIAISICLIPVTDLIKVSISRIFNRRSPFSPDRTHIHHFLVDRGYSHFLAASMLYTVQVILVGIAIGGMTAGVSKASGCLGFFSLFYYTLFVFSAAKNNSVQWI